MKKKSVSSLVAGTIAALVLAGCVEQQPVHSSTNVTESSLTNSSSSSEKTVSSSDSVTVYYNVSFDSAGGSAVETQRVESGKTATAPANPVKEATAEYSYTFLGWYLGDELYDFASPVIKDIQLVARWQEVKNKYTVSFVDADGNILQTSEVEYGQNPKFTGETPTKASTAQYHYDFKG